MVGGDLAFEEPEQRVDHLLRLVLDEEVTAGQTPPIDLSGPSSPDVEHVPVEARRGTATAPESEERAFDLPSTVVGVVMFAVDCCAGAIVLADRLDGARIVKQAPIGRHELFGIAARGAAKAKNSDVKVEKGVRGRRRSAAREGVEAARDGSVVAYLQLAHNERHPVTGSPTAKVIHNFGRAEQVDRDALARLVVSVSRFPGPEQQVLLAPQGALAGEVEVLDSRRLGGAWTLDRLWERLGIGAAIRQVATGRRLDGASHLDVGARVIPRYDCLDPFAICPILLAPRGSGEPDQASEGPRAAVVWSQLGRVCVSGSSDPAVLKESEAQDHVKRH
ncbi:MAG: hypothetical protein ABJA74_00355 [Lapillicoccus sp.]